MIIFYLKFPHWTSLLFHHQSLMMNYLEKSHLHNEIDCPIHSRGRHQYNYDPVDKFEWSNRCTLKEFLSIFVVVVVYNDRLDLPMKHQSMNNGWRMVFDDTIFPLALASRLNVCVHLCQCQSKIPYKYFLCAIVLHGIVASHLMVFLLHKMFPLPKKIPNYVCCLRIHDQIQSEIDLHVAHRWSELNVRERELKRKMNWGMFFHLFENLLFKIRNKLIRC